MYIKINTDQYPVEIKQDIERQIKAAGCKETVFVSGSKGAPQIVIGGHSMPKMTTPISLDTSQSDIETDLFFSKISELNEFKEFIWSRTLRYKAATSPPRSQNDYTKWTHEFHDFEIYEHDKGSIGIEFLTEMFFGGSLGTLTLDYYRSMKIEWFTCSDVEFDALCIQWVQETENELLEREKRGIQNEINVKKENFAKLQKELAELGELPKS